MIYIIYPIYFLLSIYPKSSGRLGQFLGRLRGRALKPLFKKMGKNVNIGRFCSFFNTKEIEFDDNSGVGNNSNISGPIKIGKNTIIAYSFLAITQNHKFNDLAVPIGNQGYKDPKPIIIEENCWIGARVIVLPGVKIARGTVVGAGSVVRDNTQSDSIVFGNPAKFVRKRGKPKSSPK
jgi:maltose O-acetyltransferase